MDQFNEMIMLSAIFGVFIVDQIWLNIVKR